MTLAARRMAALGLLGPPAAGPLDVVRRLGAVQSQEYGPAKWSLGRRLAPGSLHDADLDAMLADGRLLRTHVLRPTWHFVLPDELPLLLAVTGPRVHQLNAYYYRHNGVDDELRARTQQLFTAALRGGNQLTRKELTALLTADGITAAGLRLAYLLMRAELDGVLVSGGLAGKQHTYALYSERVPDVPVPSRAEGVAELTRRYFSSHGPATIKDFQWWASLTVTEIKAGLAAAGHELSQETVDGVTYWSAPGPAAPPPESPVVHLLQGYDEYVVGYTESKYLLDAARTARALIVDRSVFTHVLIIDTQIAGHWRRSLTGKQVTLEVALYRPLTDAETVALQAEADRHAAFVERPAEIVLSPL
jgi:hypothetical protein